MADGRLARFAGGLGLGYLHTLAVLVVGLWLTPFLLRQLGLARLRPVAAGLAGARLPGADGFRRRGAGAARGGVRGGAARGTREATAGDPVAERRPAARSAWWCGRRRSSRSRPPRPCGCCRPSGSCCGVRSRSSPPGSCWRFRCASSPRSCRGCRTCRSSGRPDRRVDRGHGHHRRAGLSPGPGSMRSRPAGSCRSCCRRSWRGAASARAFPGALPRGLARPSWREARQAARPRHVDQRGAGRPGALERHRPLVVGKLLGPEAIVPYACTGKLMTMLANQPQLFMQMALPALSELRGSAARDAALRRVAQHDAADAARQRRLSSPSCWSSTALRGLVGGGVAVRRHDADGAAAGRHARAPRQRDDRLHPLLLRPRTPPRAHEHRRGRRRAWC